MERNDPISWTIRFLERIRKMDPVDGIISELRSLNMKELIEAIPDDASKKAFWTNLYNGFSFKFIKEDPSHLRSLSRKLAHFNTKKICVAGRDLSLNDIEHGMLRKSRIWWGKGYLRRPFPSSFEKIGRVSKLDPRIHFALNCGAVSCPPIQPYHQGTVEEELEHVTKDFLSTEMELDGKEVRVSSLFKMYKGDFGGKRGILRFLKRRGFIRSTRGKRLYFLPYNWTPDPEFHELRS
jgi:hypothetical protein